MDTATSPHAGVPSPENELQRVSNDLAAKFMGVFAAQTVERYVFASYSAGQEVEDVRHIRDQVSDRFDGLLAKTDERY